MIRFSISAYQEDRSAIVEATRSFFSVDPIEENGFIVYVGECLDVDGAVSAATLAGAHSCATSEVQEAEAAIEEVAVEAAPVIEEPIVEATPVVTAEEPEVAGKPVPTLAFCARFSCVDHGQEFARVAAGKVHFAEPPTGWNGNVWCVRGLAFDLGEVEALAASCGGSTKAPAVEVVEDSKPAGDTKKNKKG